MILLTIRNGNIPYVVQNERYASYGDFVLIFFARESIVSVNSPFLQLHRQRKMADVSNFHFSHYKSMESISCHSNQSSYPIGIKNTTFVESNVLCKYAKFQLHPPYGF